MNRLRIGVIGLGWFGEICCDAYPTSSLPRFARGRPNGSPVWSGNTASTKPILIAKTCADPAIDAVSIVTMWDHRASIPPERPRILRIFFAPAKRTGRKLVIGYILRQHPSWIKFIEIARKLRTPLVFRMNLNQQSNDETWQWHKRLMASFPPIVDCGVHYVDVMCQMTSAKPIKVHAIGAKLTDEVPVNNYGRLQVIFDDGSVGWYEAGWGPMMSETAFFVKDVIGPKGCVSIMMAETAGKVKSDDINAHTKTNQILRHYADMSKPDERIDMTDEPDHDALCEREQRYLLKAIDENLDLTGHMNDAVKSLKIVMAADRSIHTGQVETL
jgi:predicted dehydrogenase